MRKTWLTVLVIAIGLSGRGWALDFDLAPKEAQALSPSAQQVYREGLTAIDHVRYDDALASFVAAQKADPASVPIRFLVAKLALVGAKKRMGDPAIQQLRKAEKALDEIVEMKEQAKPSETGRAKAVLATVQGLIVQQAERDARHARIGKEIVKERAKELYPQFAKTPEQLQAEEQARQARAKEAAQGQGGQQRRAAGRMPPPMMMGMPGM